MGQIKETQGDKEKKAVSDKWIRGMVGKARVDDKASRGRLASFVRRNLGASEAPTKRMRRVEGSRSRFVPDTGLKGGEHERKRLVAGTAGLRRLHETTEYPAGSGAGRVIEDSILHREDLAERSKAQIQPRRPSPPSSDPVPAKKNKDSSKPRALGVVGAAAGLGALTLAARMSRKKDREKKSSTAMKQSALWPDEAVRTMELQNFLNAMGSEDLKISDYTALSLDELEQLVGGAEKAAAVMAIGSHPDHHTSWLGQFVGTPLHAQAVRLAEEDLKLESERIRRRLEEPKEQDLWTKQDQLRLQQSMLVLELHKLKNQETEKKAVSDKWIRKMVHGSKAPRERLNQFANKNLIAGGKPGGNRKRLVAGAAAAERLIKDDLGKLEGSAQKSRKALDNMSAGIAATNNKFIDEHNARMRAGEADTRRRMIAGGILGGTAGAAAGLGALTLAARMSRKKGKEKKAEEEPRRPGAGTGALAGAAGVATAAGSALNLGRLSSRIGDHVIEKDRKRVDRALARTPHRELRRARLVAMARKLERKADRVTLGTMGAAGLVSALGTGAAVGAASKALAKHRDKKKTSSVQMVGHVNNGDPKPPKWPASALASISDETKEKIRKALLFGGAALIGVNTARAAHGLLKGEGISSIDRIDAAVNVPGLAAIAASGLFRPDRKKKASLADLARQAAAAAKTKRIPISAVKGQTTASGIAAAKQGIAAKASKAIPAPHDVFRSATPKASPFSGAGTATRYAPADPLPPGSMQSIEFLKKYKMASKR